MIVADMTDQKFINKNGKPKYYKVRDRKEGYVPWIWKRTWDGNWYSYENGAWALVATMQKNSSRNYTAEYDMYVLTENINEITEAEAFIEIL